MAEIKRQVAYKVNISDVNNASYVVLEGWDPNFIIVNGKKISRVNVIGTVITRDNASLMIDDGTGSIMVRNFEENKNYVAHNEGDIINVIGKVREYNHDKYIIDESIKKIDARWFALRKKEIEICKRLNIGEDASAPGRKSKSEEIVEDEREGLKEKSIENFGNVALDEEIIEVEEKKEEENSPKTTTQKIIGAIKKIDAGDGAEIEEIMKLVPDCESTISLMIKKGDIFENRAGRVKIL